MKTYESRIIGETSAGMTAIEIYIDGELYWSHDYFSMGAGQKWYDEALRQIYDDAEACAEVESWAEFEYDEDGEPVAEQHDTGESTYIVASYTPENGWDFAEPHNDGQSRDFFLRNADRIPADVVDAWRNF